MIEQNISAYKRQMGLDYEKLHPKIQKRFDFSTSNNIAFVGKGIMEKIWNGNKLAVLILKILSKSNILFPKVGENIEYEIHNYPYIDQFGREVHSMNRVFFFEQEEQRFDGSATYSEIKKHIVEYLGLDHRMVFEMELKAENGAIRFTSGRQYAFFARLKIRVPSLIRGNINLLEWYDDEKKKFYLDLKVSSKLFGPLFGFNGWFDAEYIDFKDRSIPNKFKPIREEIRE
ncbi:MAG: DUF4166 domain-containing protein [Pseudopedobacter saltans]|uniref:DUF4166 domain-containing protein n=1 Tax=Pseudopedobacter saltans TaxID=151895 RepID=A0A2W5GJ58_9SPHI|nr:MAG: DUF4166 domain-containing protein [Pseudopedobacter saltans]